jgi:hypothetical protein
MTESLTLGFDLRVADLYGRDGLVRLDARFVDFVKARNLDLHNRLMAARAVPEQVAGKAESDLIVELAPELEDFIAELFGITSDVRALQSRHQALAPLYTVKRLFVQRRAAKKYGPEQAAAFDGEALRAELEPLIGGELTELRFAEKVEAWMKAEAEHAAAALASEASGQRGDSLEVRAHSASEDARERAGDTRPEPGSSARAPESKLQRLNGLEWGRAGASHATEEIDRVPGIRR